VGTCVGIGGSRIKPILNEIGGEKIDIIDSGESTEDLIKGALKPAKIKRVELVDKENARVWVDNDQRSYAIGKSGQNIALASRLVGINIQIVQEDDHSKVNADLDSISETW
jgi:N utilization substance protein A